MVAEGERWVEVIDTGGLGIVDRDDLGPHVEAQVDVALRGADMVLFLVDVRDGLTTPDKQVAALLRGADVPVQLVVNKAEGGDFEWQAEEFRALGVGGEPVVISAQNGEGMADLRERVVEVLPGAPTEKPGETPRMKIAVVGRRNAGKSTLVNHLAGEERMIVSEIEGTTRDAVDVVFERDGETFVVIDTAGVRKRSKMEDAIEFFSDARSMKTIRRADVVVLLFDVTRKMSAIEKNLARYAIDRYKPLILAANKWDLAEGQEPEKFREYLDAQLPGLSFCPIVFLSAKEGLRTDELIEVANDLFEQGQQRVPTGDLNRVLERALEASAEREGLPDPSATRRRPRSSLPPSCSSSTTRSTSGRTGCAIFRIASGKSYRSTRCRCASCSRTRTPKKRRSRSDDPRRHARPRACRPAARGRGRVVARGDLL